jgi:hypothetical protein
MVREPTSWVPVAAPPALGVPQPMRRRHNNKTTKN